MAELLTQTFAAGETKHFAKGGAYFEIIDSLAGVDVTFYDDVGGGQIDKVNGALSGVFLGFGFGGFDITSATAQTVQVLICARGEKGGSRRQPGNVTVIDKVGAAVQTQGAASTAVTAFTATQILAPATNINGVIVRGLAAEVLAGATGNSDCMIIAAPAAPAGAANVLGNNILTLARVVDSAQVRTVFNAWDMRKQIPAGWGIFHCAVNGVAAAAANACRISFEVL